MKHTDMKVSELKAFCDEALAAGKDLDVRVSDVNWKMVDVTSATIMENALELDIMAELPEEDNV